MRVLVFEPYYGGSHKAFLAGLLAHLPCEFILYTLPAHSWKWRMRLAAPYFAAQLRDLAAGEAGDCLFCSSMLDVAAFKGLLPRRFRDLPLHVYFHENQFAYPVQVHAERDVHFGLTNLTTALAADKIAFNSRYNLESFLAGARDLLVRMPDMRLPRLEETIRAKATVLYPALDFSDFARTAPPYPNRKAPAIVWNHRWEHDKNPELFFNGLFALAEQRVAFQLIVLGKSFRSRPPVFAEAQERLADRIIHFGHAESREEYRSLLQRGDVVVSTALHEFYGIAVLEAVRCGCRPLVPDRLSYPELFPSACRFADHDFVETLARHLALGRLESGEAHALTERYSWQSQFARYRQWFAS
ncbi:tRNA-queuosine alpha-mannosyltransferase domain-containing protein [Thiovibrio sp. JS02]